MMPLWHDNLPRTLLLIPMLKNLKELFQLLTREQRKKLLGLQVLVVLMAFAEIAGVLSIGPFMAIVGDIQQLNGDGHLAQLYRLSGLASPEKFLFWMGVGVLCMLTAAALISMYTTWRLAIYGSRIGAELSSRLYKHYMYQPWLFHSGGSSSQLTNQVIQECNRVTNNIIKQLLQMNAKLFMTSLMALAIFLYNPVVALAGITIFLIAYLLLYRTVRRRLDYNGKVITAVQRQRFKLMNEGFGGIKDALLLGRQPVFIQCFDAASQKFARAQGVTEALSQVPRYAMELVAFGAVIFLVLYLLAAHQGNLGAILPILSVYALAGFKLLPAFQQIYNSVSQVRANLAAFEAIREDLYASREVMLAEHSPSVVASDEPSIFCPQAGDSPSGYCVSLSREGHPCPEGADHGGYGQPGDRSGGGLGFRQVYRHRFATGPDRAPAGSGADR